MPRHNPASPPWPGSIDERVTSAKRLRPGEIAVVDHVDMDRAAAVALVEAGVAAVVNAAPSISGRYPNLGPRHLIDAGVVLVDDVGGQVLAAVDDGEPIRVDGGSVYLGDELIGDRRRQDRRSVAAAMEAQRTASRAASRRCSANAVEQLRRERDLLLDGVGVPRLATPFQGRQVVVVVQGVRLPSRPGVTEGVSP